MLLASLAVVMDLHYPSIKHIIIVQDSMLPHTGMISEAWSAYLRNFGAYFLNLSLLRYYDWFTHSEQWTIGIRNIYLLCHPWDGRKLDGHQLI
jgi:hypothetical protein